MFSAESLNPSQLILLGLSILTAALLLRRAVVFTRQSQGRDTQAEDRPRFAAAEQTAGAVTRQIELRLHRRGGEIVVHGDGTSLWTVTHAEDFAVGFVGLIGNTSAVGHPFHITAD